MSTEKKTQYYKDLYVYTMNKNFNNFFFVFKYFGNIHIYAQEMKQWKFEMT